MDDTHLDAQLRHTFTTLIYDTQMRIKEGPVIKEDDTHLHVVTLRRAFMTRIAYH